VLTDQIFQPFCHHDCLHNQLVSIANRVCGVVPAPTVAGLADLKVAATRIADALPKCVPEDYYMMPLRYSGGKRTRYIQATDEVLAFGLNKLDASVKMFVKSEKIAPDPDKPNPDPRAIQFRNPKYCVELGRFLKPIEEHLYLFRHASSGVPKSRNIAKGLNQEERAALLVKKAAFFTDPVFVCLDMKRFDKHVSKALLKLEHSVYLASIQDAYFAWLLSLQLVNRCITSRGIKYKTAGRRMSGDMNTALGNCVLALMMLIAFLDWCPKWDCLDDGDDSVVIVERQYLPRVLATVRERFLSFGMQVKVEHVADDIHDVEFCQSKIIELNPDRFSFIRNPWKVLSCALVGVKYFNQDGARARLLYTIGLCELILNRGVPVLQDFALAILRNCTTERTLDLPFDGSLMTRVRRELRALKLKHLVRIDPEPITEVARSSFHRAYGVSPDGQVYMEDWLRSWTFEIEGTIELPEEWDVPQWDHRPADTPELYYP